jgi:hypothetical protein
MYAVNPASQNSITGWTTVTGFTAGDASPDFSFASNTLTKSSSSASALYFVSFSISFSGNVTSNWTAGISVNGSIPNSITATRSLSSQDVGNVSASGYLTLNPNDVISFRINPPSSANLTVAYAAVTLVKVEDISAYNSYAETGFYNNTSSLSISQAFVDLTNASYTSSNLQNWSQTSGVLTAGTGSAGTYLVSASFNFNGSASTAYTLGVSLNNSNPAIIIGTRKINNNNDIGNVTIGGILTIAEGNTIRLKVLADGNNKNLTVEYCHIYLTKIDGGARGSDPISYASMRITALTTPITLTSATDNQITGYSDDITNSFWSFSNNQLSPSGISAGFYRVNYFISYSTSAGVDMTFKVKNNGTEILQLTGLRRTSNSDRGALAGNGIILISDAADKLSMFANPTSGVNLSVYQSRLSLSRIYKTSDINLPVELSSFSASIIGSSVKLNWKTATEINNYGFDVERMSRVNGQTSENWKTIGFVNGSGNSNSPKSYSFTDQSISAGKYSYRLKQIDNDGQFEYSKTIEVDFGAPKKFELTQNYPNPFNPSTTIRFNLPEAGNVKLIIYNILGQEIQTLVNEFKEAGVHTINFNADNLNSGLYIYKLEAGSFIQTRKMTLVK